MLYLLLAASLPILAAFAISIFISPVFLSRYLIVALPPLYLFISWIFAGYQPSLAGTLRGALVGVMAIMLAYQVVSPAVPVKQDYRGAANYLTEKAAPQDVIILSAPFTIYPVEYYYRGDAQLVTLPVWDRFKQGSAPEFSADRLETDAKNIQGDHELAYLLLSEDQGYQDQIKLYYDTHYQRVEEKQFSPDLTLYVYRLRYDVPTTAD